MQTFEEPVSPGTIPSTRLRTERALECDLSHVIDGVRLNKPVAASVITEIEDKGDSDDEDEGRAG